MSFYWEVCCIPILFSSILIAPLSFADPTSIPTPLQQLKNGELAENVKCPTNMVLVERSFIHVACVSPTTANSIVKRGWGHLAYSDQKFLIIEHNKVLVRIYLQEMPIHDDFIFVNHIGGEMERNFTDALFYYNNNLIHADGFAAFIPIDKLWTLENNPRIIGVEADYPVSATTNTSIKMQ